MNDNKRYQFYKEQHPDWSDEQIWTAISIDMQTAQTIKQGGDDVDVNNPEIIADILEGAKRWLKEVLPHIFEKIGKIIDTAISNVVTWVKKGFDYLIDIIGSIFNHKTNEEYGN